MSQALLEGLGWINQFINKAQKWCYAALVLGLLLWLSRQNPRLGEIRFYSLLMEAGILSIFGVGWWIAARTGRKWRLVTLFWLYLFGLTFEVLTENFWDYLNVIFLIRGDISLTFPMAWAGLCIGATSASEWLWRGLRMKDAIDLKDHLLPRLDVLVWILMGAVAETSFHLLDVIHSYNVAFPLGVSPTGVPWAVYLGYGLCPGFLVSMLIRNLESPSRD